MELRSGHGALAVSTIPRFPAYIVQLHFLHLFPKGLTTGGCADSKQVEEQFTVLNYSNIQRLTGKFKRQLITMSKYLVLSSRKVTPEGLS